MNDAVSGQLSTPLTTTWLGLTLRSPLVASASPLCRDLDNIRRLEDAGAGAIVLPSLFQEQIEAEAETLRLRVDAFAESSAEARGYFPAATSGPYSIWPDHYLDLVRRARTAVDIPVLASLNGSSPNIHLIERFTRVAPDVLLYRYTVEDPTTWTKPWTAEIPMTKTAGEMYEYACHEGNYGMFGIMAGARAMDKESADAAKKPKPAQVSLAWEGKSGLQVNVHSAPPLKADVLLAITEDGLSTQVPKGENAGTTLHHAAVVRQLHEVGKLDNGTFEKMIDVALDPAWQPVNLKAAVLVQDPSSKKILGAGVVAFPQ